MPVLVCAPYSWSPGRWDSSHYASWMKIICLFPGLGWCCWLTRPYVSGTEDRADPIVCVYPFVLLRPHPHHPRSSLLPSNVRLTHKHPMENAVCRVGEQGVHTIWAKVLGASRRYQTSNNSLHGSFAVQRNSELPERKLEWILDCG